MPANVVLVKPPEGSSLSFGTFSLATLAAAVRHLADVTIFDATSMPAGEAAEAVWSRHPDLIGVTVMDLPSVRSAADFVTRLGQTGDRDRDRSACAPIVAGGHGASMAPGVLLAAGADAVVIGEGELTFQSMIEEGIRPGAPGLAYLVGGHLHVGPRQQLVEPLDRLPLPARDLLPPPPDGVHLMETSRGCTHACTFCETTRFSGRRWRAHSAQRVAAQVASLVDQHDAWVIHFADDSFAASPSRVLDICRQLRHVSLPAFFMISARADDLAADPSLLPAMAHARILHVSVGVETLDPPAAMAAGKAIAPDVYGRLFKRMRELGMFSVASYIVGLPGESPAARERAVGLAVIAGSDSAEFRPLLPLPETSLTSDQCLDPLPADVREAQQLTAAFLEHPLVQARLEAAAGGDSVRAMLARAALDERLTRPDSGAICFTADSLQHS
jgi:anaerobic magnesium-protoporphyrin IX monomethyl ester cyclase